MGDYTWLDLLLLAVILVSSLLGIWRGLVSEVLSLLAWVAAFFAAKTWGDETAMLMAGAVRGLNDPGLRYIVGFVTVFALTLVLFAIARMLLSSLLRAVGLGLVDRLLGSLFGLGRGLLVAWIAVLLAGLTNLPRETWWRDSLLVPPLETAVIASKPWLPPALAQKIRYRASPGPRAGRQAAMLRSGNREFMNFTKLTDRR